MEPQQLRMGNANEAAQFQVIMDRENIEQTKRLVAEQIGPLQKQIGHLENRLAKYEEQIGQLHEKNANLEMQLAQKAQQLEEVIR